MGKMLRCYREGGSTARGKMFRFAPPPRASSARKGKNGFLVEAMAMEGKKKKGREFFGGSFDLPR